MPVVVHFVDGVLATYHAVTEARQDGRSIVLSTRDPHGRVDDIAQLDAREVLIVEVSEHGSLRQLLRGTGAS